MENEKHGQGKGDNAEKIKYAVGKQPLVSSEEGIDRVPVEQQPKNNEQEVNNDLIDQRNFQHRYIPDVGNAFCNEQRRQGE